MARYITCKILSPKGDLYKLDLYHGLTLLEEDVADPMKSEPSYEYTKVQTTGRYSFPLTMLLIDPDDLKDASDLFSELASSMGEGVNDEEFWLETNDSPAFFLSEKAPDDLFGWFHISSYYALVKPDLNLLTWEVSYED